jgi:hypothetical protein
VPILIGPLQTEGALVEVRIGWSASAVRQRRAALHPIPPPEQVWALIDSGAESTCLDTDLMQRLGLPLAGFSLANIPASGGQTVASEHDASLTLLHTSGNPQDCLTLPDLMVMALPIGALGYQALIGRDVLARCRFLYDGPRSEFQLEY